MKILPFAALVVVSLVYGSCSSSTQANGPLADYSIVVKPKVGSIFVYQQSEIDTNGNTTHARPPSDSIFTLVAADTTFMGRSHVWLYLSGELPGRSYTGDYFAIAYLDNGDLDYWESGFQNYILYWIRLPSATHRLSDAIIDSAFEEGIDLLHERDTTHAVYIEDIARSTVSGQLQAMRLSFTIATTVSVEGGNSTSSLTTSIADFAPSIGFFSRLETQYMVRIGDTTLFQGVRRQLKRYELK